MAKLRHPLSPSELFQLSETTIVRQARKLRKYIAKTQQDLVKECIPCNTSDFTMSIELHYDQFARETIEMVLSELRLIGWKVDCTYDREIPSWSIVMSHVQ
ncbi:MAG: hypothetical protein WBP12_03900 [Candidatus Saccharimonas sp.]